MSNNLHFDFIKRNALLVKYDCISFNLFNPVYFLFLIINLFLQIHTGVDYKYRETFIFQLLLWH